MRIRRFAIAACHIALLAGLSGKAAAQQELTWAIPPFPPAYIEEHGEITGYAAQTQQWLMDRLPQYHHVAKRVPLARLLAEMRSDELRCSLTLIPTEERKEYIYFAKPIMISLAPSVIVLKRQLPAFRPYLNARNEVELDRLLGDISMNVALRHGRSYGEFIDKIVARHRSQTNIITVGSDEKFIQLLEMGRLDWAMYLPTEAEYHHRKANTPGEILSLPIANAKPYIEATMGCSKTRAGKQAIEDVNAILDAYPQRPWLRFYQAWVPPGDRVRYRQMLETVTATRLTQADPVEEPASQ
ncbi:TIGR02285 family protein [Thalassospira marina]|uniref:Uncharacterized protein n=1 Tax=Thalassospira marina TaxID=2048283 RepID=A0A2N3KRG6_9PROT|nr:TIGR02285 family protein [Thalassospira marina]PKR53142.1 hypothetical protein COO20_15850 [Thalassospira marina]